jgi:hypothetical protein
MANQIIDGLAKQSPAMLEQAIDSVSAVRSCDACGGRMTANSWGADVCCGCHSIFASILPSQEELNRFYAQFNLTYSGGGRERGAADRQKRYACRYLSYVRRYREHGNLLDVGSSTNPFPNYAAAAGFRVTVLDHVRPGHLSPEIEFIKGTAGKKPHLEGRFEVVTAFAVVEHFLDLLGSVKALASYAAPEGVIVMTTPLVGDLFERNAPGRSRWFCPPEHLHLVSAAGLASLFESCDCVLVEQSRFELDLLRWGARYGIAAVEGLAGLATRAVSARLWGRLRDNRVATSQQIGLYVFKAAKT